MAARNSRLGPLSKSIFCFQSDDWRSPRIRMEIKTATIGKAKATNIHAVAASGKKALSGNRDLKIP